MSLSYLERPFQSLQPSVLGDVSIYMNEDDINEEARYSNWVHYHSQ